MAQESNQDKMIFAIDDVASGKRLDQYLSQLLLGRFSRAYIQNAIKSGLVFIDGEIAKSPSLKLRNHKQIKMLPLQPQEAKLLPQNIKLSILYEDNDLIVLDKGAGIVVHPGAGNIDGTLVNALLYHCADSLSGIGGVKRPGIVHRLDKNTSGVMVVAKNDFCHQALSEQFADHGRTNQMERRYQALSWGRLTPSQGRIETYLARSNRDRTKRAVVSATTTGAKLGITNYQTIAHYQIANQGHKNGSIDLSLVECKLATGRTHQIRVHMAHIGAPIVADPEYGSGFNTKANKLPPVISEKIKGLGRQALHASFLQFQHPREGKLLNFVSPLPSDMLELVNLLEQYNFGSR